MKNNTLESVSCSSSGAAGGRDADGSGDADVPAGSYDTPSAAQHCTTSAAPAEAVPQIGRERLQVEIAVAPPPSPLPQRHGLSTTLTKPATLLRAQFLHECVHKRCLVPGQAVVYIHRVAYLLQARHAHFGEFDLHISLLVVIALHPCLWVAVGHV